MPIQWRTDYAVRLMYEAARVGRRATVQYLADTGEIPYDFARQIANDLVHAGLLASRRGPRGGMELAKAPEDISMVDIFRATGELPALSLCTHGQHGCPKKDDCQVRRGVWERIDDQVLEHLSNVTLAEALAAGEGEPGAAV